MRTPSIDGIRFHPLQPGRIAAASRKVIAEITCGREHHFRVSLSSDAGIEVLTTDCAVQQASVERQMIDCGQHSFVAAEARRHGLWIKELRIDVVDVLGSNVNGRRHEMRGRNDVIELAERIDRLVLGFVVGK